MIFLSQSSAPSPPPSIAVLVLFSFTRYELCPQGIWALISLIETFRCISVHCFSITGSVFCFVCLVCFCCYFVLVFSWLIWFLLVFVWWGFLLLFWGVVLLWFYAFPRSRCARQNCSSFLSGYLSLMLRSRSISDLCSQQFTDVILCSQEAPAQSVLKDYGDVLQPFLLWFHIQKLISGFTFLSCFLEYISFFIVLVIVSLGEKLALWVSFIW